MDKVKVGMIGAGGRAQTHYSSLAEMKDVKMAAICDLNEERTKSTAEKYGIKERFTDYKLMLEKVDLDAVYAIMDPSYLDPIVTHCLKQGKNIFIEKPPGISPEQTRKWAELAQKNDCKTIVGFQRRFHPIAVEAKRRVEERNRILYCMAAFHKHQLLTAFRSWVMTVQRKGGQLSPDYMPSRTTNQLLTDIIHAVDLLLWMGGDVKKIHSLFGQLYADHEYFDPLHVNFWSAAFEFKSGGVGFLSSNRTAGGRALYFEMHGKGISAYGNIPGLPGIDNCLIQKDDEPYEKAEVIKNEQLIGINAPRTHLDGSFQVNRHFIDCIKEDGTPQINFEEAVKTMEVISESLLGRRLPPVF